MSAVSSRSGHICWPSNFIWTAPPFTHHVEQKLRRRKTQTWKYRLINSISRPFCHLLDCQAFCVRLRKSRALFRACVVSWTSPAPPPNTHTPPLEAENFLLPWRKALSQSRTFGRFHGLLSASCLCCLSVVPE